MGTSTSIDQFAAKITKAGTNLKEAEQVSIVESAQAGKAIMLANMGFTRMRGVGRKGARVGVRYTVKGGSSPSVLLGYFGPVHLANNPTSPHRIEPKSGRSGKKAIVVGGQPVANADHPGTAGKKFFERSKPQVQQTAGKILERSVQTALRRSF